MKKTSKSAYALAKKKAMAEDKKEETKPKGLKSKRHENAESKTKEAMEDSQWRK